MTWESKDAIRRDRNALRDLTETQRNAIAELQAQIHDYSRGLGMMRSLWPALQPVIVFRNPVGEHWELDVRSLEIMVAVVQFGAEIMDQLKSGNEQMAALPPQEVVLDDPARD